MNEAIRIISTGGTIDSLEYKQGEKSKFLGTYIPTMLALARLTVPVELEQVMQKDSSDITDADRNLIYERCDAAREDHIVITHGTDTMTETARFLGEKNVPNKVIVLVGSFVPFSQPNSDALFNLGYAIAAAQTLAPGVWVAVNGDIFSWNNVRKNKEKGRFEKKE